MSILKKNIYIKGSAFPSKCNNYPYSNLLIKRFNNKNENISFNIKNELNKNYNDSFSDESLRSKLNDGVVLNVPEDSPMPDFVKAFWLLMFMPIPVDKMSTEENFPKTEEEVRMYMTNNILRSLEETRVLDLKQSVNLNLMQKYLLNEAFENIFYFKNGITPTILIVPENSAEFLIGIYTFK